MSIGEPLQAMTKEPLPRASLFGIVDDLGLKPSGRPQSALLELRIPQRRRITSICKAKGVDRLRAVGMCG